MIGLLTCTLEAALLKGWRELSFASCVTPFAQILADRMRRQAPPPRYAPFEDAVAAFECDVARAALPDTQRAGGAALPDWSLELGVEYPCTLHELKRAFRRAALRTHPDCGGSHDAFLRTQALFETARRDISSGVSADLPMHVSPYARRAVRPPVPATVSAYA